MTIFTDSLNACVTLESLKSGNIWEHNSVLIWEILQENINIDVNFWCNIPSHIGISGNENENTICNVCVEGNIHYIFIYVINFFFCEVYVVFLILRLNVNIWITSEHVWIHIKWWNLSRSRYERVVARSRRLD